MTSFRPSVDTITLFVDDLSAAKRFYLDVFAVPIHYEDSNSVVFRFGATQVNLLDAGAAPELVAPALPGGAGTPPRSVFTIDVDDVDAAATEIAAHGAVLLNGPMNRPWGIRTASFQDPAGHIWELAAPIPPADAETA